MVQDDQVDSLMEHRHAITQEADGNQKQTLKLFGELFCPDTKSQIQISVRLELLLITDTEFRASRFFLITDTDFDFSGI